MLAPTPTRAAPTGTPSLPLSLPHPVTARVTHPPDDLAVMDAAGHPAARRNPPPLPAGAGPGAAGPSPSSVRNVPTMADRRATAPAHSGEE
ncbi:hypothetical protein ACFYOV_20655 [Streptomyces sp. NPDC005931]|uniref:hypothetical protein n=1 Tax=Streptomyces sp. NPDC005931 TaxID=3364737 RepID=UPI0036B4E576